MRILLLAVILGLPCSLLAQQAPDYASITGTFEGDVFNGDDLDPITTVFKLVNNRLVGGYSVSAEQGVYEGTISNIIYEDSFTISAEWTDKFGEGLLQLQFSSDFSNFSGFWWNLDEQQELPWSGVRQ